MVKHHYRKMMDGWVSLNKRKMPDIVPGSRLDIALRELIRVLDQQANASPGIVRSASVGGR